MIAAEWIREQAHALGFNHVGLIPAEPSPRLDAYLRWIEAGMHSELGYMARADRVARRRDLNVILPGVQSMILVGLDYSASALPVEQLRDPARGRIAAYAWGLDYHEMMLPRLEALADWLRSHSPRDNVQCRAYVDTGAILERSHAQRAGMGFIGKNTMLIQPRRGSYFFLGELLIDETLDEYDRPGRESLCGTCTRCQSACPTHAFPAPYVLDARRCISYLTIEHKGAIDPALRPQMGNWIYGCDICQEVCPFTRFAPTTAEIVFQPASLDRAAPPLLDLLRMDDADFLKRFAGSPVERIKRDRLVRNACIAAGNWGDPAALPALRDLMADRSPLVRDHAEWAIQKIEAR